MAKLYELTDGYAPEETIDGLPVEPALPTDRPRVVINTAEFDKPKEEKPSAYENLTKGIKNLLGLGEEERYQLWPEKVVREGLTAAGDIAKPNPYAEGSEQWYEYERLRQDAMVPAAMSISALAGSGGLASKGGSLNATPSLRPALKYKEKLYKGKPGQEHQDIIPKDLYDDFSRKAMSGEDLAEYNFGFINDKGHFLNREDALKYGIDTGLIDPHSGRFGALTTTLMADSSKPGTAIEAMAKTYPLAKPADRWQNTLGQNDYLLRNMSPDEFLKNSRPLKIDAESRENIDALKQHIKEGKPLDPLELHKNGKEDGRHRAIAAKELGIKEVPVINFRDNAPTFYSAVEHTVKNIPQSKMTGDQWLGTLINKPGVKGEELDWTGLKSFLEENKGKPVTKQQIEDHIASNKVELKEVVKGEEKTLNQRIEEYKNKGFDQSEAETRAYADKDATNFQNTKYHSYQLPGGENYREMLLTLPQKSLSEAEARQVLGAKPDAKLSPADIEYASRKNSSEYKSSHWDEPNILAHVRMNDRNIDGKKSLHLEEIQSDWHQQGRDRGYKQGVQEIKGFKPEELKLEKGEYDWSGISPDGRSAKVGQGVAKTEQEARDYLTRHLNKLAAEKNSAARIAESDKLPDAPFKKTWHELALKRMIKEAAEKGYDRLSWTPGEAQAARYDLSKQVDNIRLVNKSKWTDPNFEFRLDAFDKNGNRVVSHGINTEKEAADLIGKEAANKLFNSEKLVGGDRKLENADLKIGGEGMKGFYDQIIPKALEKLGKEHGVKVKKGNIGSDKIPDYFDVEHTGSGWRVVDRRLNEGQGTFVGPIHKSGADAEKWLKTQGELKQPIFYIDIPQSLKDTALRKGFPLFSNAHPGFTFIPVQGNPFENSK